MPCIPRHRISVPFSPPGRRACRGRDRPGDEAGSQRLLEPPHAAGSRFSGLFQRAWSGGRAGHFGPQSSGEGWLCLRGFFRLNPGLHTAPPFPAAVLARRPARPVLRRERYAHTATPGVTASATAAPTRAPLRPQACWLRCSQCRPCQVTWAARPSRWSLAPRERLAGPARALPSFRGSSLGAGEQRLSHQ